MDNDIDDYMSSSFLNVTEDIRPGLLKSKGLKRKYEIEKKRVESNKQHYMKPRKVLEEEKRNAGMDCALTSDNKGFALLQKMGYKPGMKLGKPKPETSNSGLKEPIKVQIKAGRGGLGRDEEIKKKLAEKEQRRSSIKVWKEKETARLTEEFRQRMKDKVVFKHLISDLRKCQKVCEQLDTDSGIEEPIRPWFWFSVKRESEEGDEEVEEEEYDEDEPLEPEEQLCMLLDYLRGNYFYCVWCGTRYDSEDDMFSNCPGTEKDDHE